jgi:hypothetical protein
MDASIVLFNERNVDEVWIERRQDMERHCAEVTDEDVLTRDLGELSQQIAKPYIFEIPELLLDQLSRDEPVFTRGSDKARLNWYIPVRGDYRILGYYHRNRPSSPRYQVGFQSGALVIWSDVARDRILNSKQSVDDVVIHIDQYLPDVRRILDIYSIRFAQFAKSILGKRLSDLKANEKARETLLQIPVPVRRRADEIAEAFLPPARKVIPIPPTAKSTDVTPVLEMKAYDDILSTITAMAHGIERSPKTFEGMNEEDIRIVLLIGLNAIYEGMATGETFNGAGKTDILIRVADKTIFIAECLVWDGEAKLRQKLDDQLLKYVIWRDTKAALIVFNRTKNLTAILKIIEECVAAHVQCVRRLRARSETELRFEFRRADDPDRRFYLTCLAFNVPEKPKA